MCMLPSLAVTSGHDLYIIIYGSHFGGSFWLPPETTTFVIDYTQLINSEPPGFHLYTN